VEYLINSSIDNRKRNVNEKGGEKLTQMVVFDLGDQAFAVEVDTVREIIRWQDVRHIPQTPASLLGVSTIRGEVLPVIDLASFFGIESDSDVEKKFIIMEFNEDNIKAVIAVDTVRRIYNVPDENMDNTLQGTFVGDNLKCVIKQEGGNILMPDFRKIIAAFRLETIKITEAASEDASCEPEQEETSPE